MNINATLLGQTLAFVLFVAICWRYVWPPIIAIMEEREKRISDGLEAAKKANDSLEEAKLNYEAELDKAKSESADIVEKANQRASQIISEAKTKAEAEAEKIIASANKYEPHLITNYLRELSQEIHSYYNKHQILVEEEDLRNARLSLMEATKYVFENSGKIIGINMPDKM